MGFEGAVIGVAREDRVSGLSAGLDFCSVGVVVVEDDPKPRDRKSSENPRRALMVSCALYRHTHSLLRLGFRALGCVLRRTDLD